MIWLVKALQCNHIPYYHRNAPLKFNVHITYLRTFKSDGSWTEEWAGCLEKLCTCGSQTVQDAVGNDERDGKRARGTGANAFNITSLVYATKSTEATLLVLDKKASDKEQAELQKMFPDAKIQTHTFEEKKKVSE